MSETFSNWKSGVPADIHVSMEDVSACFNRSTLAGNNILTEEVLEVKCRFFELVRTQVDRNPGEIVVKCAYLYYVAMCDLFVRSTGYVICQEREEEVWKKERADFNRVGLTKLGKWDTRGKSGKAYVMPKHKDLSKFRPICPTFEEPTIKICKKVSKALNLLLNSIPKSCHFNLPDVSQLAKNIGKVNS